MRNIVLFLFLAMPDILCGQDAFEGIIEYRIISTGTGEIAPSGTMSFYIRGQDLLIRAHMAEVPGSRILLKSSENAAYMIDDSSKNVIRLELNPGLENIRMGEVPEEFRKEYEGALREVQEKSDTSVVTFKPASETRVIVGYECRKYNILGADGNLESVAWLTREIQFHGLGKFGDKTGIMGGLFTSEGFPLRIENMNNSEGEDQPMIVEATKVRKASLDPELFQVPVGYHVQDLFGIFKD
ncbi:MAG TPA: DUF4412 domain-containing protein [Cyclobacteriaceae bacterium]|nr:DUF4412 domain-containing protein [Cyclobacteriaceae bacterium]